MQASSTVSTGAANRVGPGHIRSLSESFRRSLLAENKSPRTIKTYSEGLGQFADHLERSGMPTDVAHITREHVETFVADLLARWKPATASNRYRALQAACRDADPEIFFRADQSGRADPDDEDDPALAYCDGCPARETCLAWALQKRERFGVWGGTTARQRAGCSADLRSRTHAVGALSSGRGRRFRVPRQLGENQAEEAFRWIVEDTDPAAIPNTPESIDDLVKRITPMAMDRVNEVFRQSVDRPMAFPQEVFVVIEEAFREKLTQLFADRARNEHLS